MENIVIATLKSWNKTNAENFDYLNKYIITKKEELTFEKLTQIKPKYVFFPHWSYIIPKNIYENFECIVFHMTDLPFGRGGSPLQNLISSGIYETKISAIKVNEGIDTGDVYFKENLSLYGSAEEIYMRASEIIFNKMIPYIIKNNPQPVPQTGVATTFNRRKPESSEITENMLLKQIYDQIRMLDAEDYPDAFIKFGKYKLTFNRAKLVSDGIIADVKIME
ncbi:MAG: methionyl-tRNA formyltransferase [Oscillospiraceae bacterium]|jgi:methionyl-tRNA formyltransferase|nr:methionyl-tRNA formyltransferase [Oscillospiraceae bacterium]